MHFIDCYNRERPTRRSNMKCPAELYLPSPRPTTGWPSSSIRSTTDHHRHPMRPHLLGRRKINLSTVFAGQSVGIKQVSDEIWLVSFMDYDLGYFDDETCRLENAQNPSLLKCYPCLRYKPLLM